MSDPFEVWLRTVCFQKPTPEAYDLAKDAWQAAQSQPAPPAPASVQEITPLLNAYVRACVSASVNVVTGTVHKDEEAKFKAAFKPLQAALTALVDERDRLKFELDGVNAMRGPLSKEKILFLADSHLAYQIYGAEESGVILFARVIEKLHGIAPEQGESHE